MFRQELAAARKTLDKSHSDRVVLYILSTDALCHVLSWEQAKQEFIEFDRWLERMCYDYHANLHITVFADHGNDFVFPKRIKLTEPLERAGLKRRDSLKEPFDFALPRFGLINFVCLYTRNIEATRRIVRVCRGLEGVELVIYQDAPSPYEPVIVANKEAIARVYFRRADVHEPGGHTEYRYRYDWDPAQGDPLLLADVAARLQAEDAFDEDGFASDEAWLRATWDHVFPDPLRRVHECMHGVVLNGADVVLSLAEGYYTGSSLIDLAGDIHGTHGGLRDSSTTTFFLSTAFEPPLYLRGEDILPAINEHVPWVPHIPGVDYARVLPALQTARGFH
jgi:hypothetical protein